MFAYSQLNFFFSIFLSIFGCSLNVGQCYTGDHQSSLLFKTLVITLSRPIEQVKAQLLPLFILVYVFMCVL